MTIHIYYRILEVNKQEALIVVRYWTKNVSEDDLRITDPVVDPHDKFDVPALTFTDMSLNLWNPKNLTTEEIHKYIQRSAPVEWLEKMETIKLSNIDLSVAENMVGQTFDFQAARTLGRPKKETETE